MNHKVFTHSFLFCALTYILYTINTQIPNSVDLLGSDESLYLKYGVLFRQHLTQEWAPSYNLWYYIISRFTSNTIELYYLNIQALLTVSVFLIYGFVYQISRNAIIGFIFSCLFALHPIAIGVLPKISAYCLLIILFTLNVAYLFKDTLKKAVVFSIGLFWCWYARPEFSISFIFSFLIVVYVVICRIRLKKQNPSLSFAVYLGCLFCIILLLKPFTFKTMGGIDKMYVAFVQHWGIYYTITHQKQLANVTFYELYNKTLVDLFGTERTFIGIIKHQPLIVIKHIGINFLVTLKMQQKLFEDYCLPAIYFGWLKKINHFLFVGIICSLAYFFRKNISLNPKKWSKESQLFALFMFLCFIAISIPNFIIGFQEHYFFLMFGWILLCCIYFISRNTQNKIIHLTVFITLISIIILIKPDLKKNIYPHSNPADAANLPNKIIYNYLKRNSTRDQKITMVATESGCEIYFNRPNLHVIPIFLLGFENGKSFLESIHDNKTDYILVDKILYFTAKNNADKGLYQIIENPKKYGFSKKIRFSKLKETYLLKR